MDKPAPALGWRAVLAHDPALDRLFRQAADRIEALLPHCPQRSDLVHGDLLARNVLLSPDAARITAVFSWKCSVLGDFLFDTAWCTFWSAWHPGIAAMDAWAVTAVDTPSAQLLDADVRHFCYELVIGAHHLGWYTWQGDPENLTRTAERTRAVLERGPLVPVG